MTNATVHSTNHTQSLTVRRSLAASVKVNYQLYLFLAPALLYFLVFRYGPMYGVQIAFKDYFATRGILRSEWVGFVHFQRFFASADFRRTLTNTILLSLFQLVAGFPVPIVLALLLNQLPSRRYKKLVQTITYAPHFISTVVMVGILFVFLSPRTGIVNLGISALGGSPIFFMADASWFRPLYVLSGIWQSSGWASIVYLAALSSISPELHEAAIVDGATKTQRIRHIDLPGLMPTAAIMLILNLGNFMSLGFEKAFLMQTSLNISTSEIIATYVYKVGLLGAQFSFSTAVGLFESVINLVLILLVNGVIRRRFESALF